MMRRGTDMTAGSPYRGLRSALPVCRIIIKIVKVNRRRGGEKGEGRENEGNGQHRVKSSTIARRAMRKMRVW